MAYLMLPATTAEKFVFELLSRIVAFIILTPLLFWIIANVEGTIVHSFFPELVNYQFSFGKSLSSATRDAEFMRVMFLIIQVVLFGFIAPFTGASHFSKSPLFKTLLTFSIVSLGYFLFSYLLVKSLNLQGFHPRENSLLFMKNGHLVLQLMGIGMVIVNLTFLAIAWFSLKEKEA